MCSRTEGKANGAGGSAMWVPALATQIGHCMVLLYEAGDSSGIDRPFLVVLQKV